MGKGNQSQKRKRKQKRAKVKSNPQVKKEPRIGETRSTYQDHPSWQLSIMDMDGPFGWGAIDGSKLLEVRARLSDLESMTWAEILAQGKHWNHSIEVWKLEKPARDRLGEIGRDDVDNLLSLRLSSAERVWGIYAQGVMRILWWDPDHQVYVVEKPNT